MVIEGFVINGGCIAADALETYAFVIGQHEAGMFNFVQIPKWLRTNVDLYA